MTKITMTFRGKEILATHPVIKIIIWNIMCFFATGLIILVFAVIIVLLPIHAILCILTLGRFKLIRFDQ